MDRSAQIGDKLEVAANAVVRLAELEPEALRFRRHLRKGGDACSRDSMSETW